ncbi:hypothetical protein CANCADRAFT_42871 [Tortispora caseinolytica NRRL Y-17796]|uniref:Deacetylase sirtuin-type domain-containing protein n=1 Tax=Tortispora caseinolytica NRRL Y-17796 TaxID=767744 RepID=A0A1E4TKK0_9ASCO|nr:hypothetical protein CANCADRAFT_42871 [Tortispora caseinolytica NRRL Y-17796]
MFYTDPTAIWSIYREKRQVAHDTLDEEPLPAVAQIVRWARALGPAMLTVSLDPDVRLEAAGHPGGESLIKVRGDLFRQKCTGFDCTNVETLSAAAWSDTVEVPLCTVCGTVMRPDVVWDGEPLRLADVDHIDAFVAQATAVSVVGDVNEWPIAGYVRRLQSKGCPLTIYNLDGATIG